MNGIVEFEPSTDGTATSKRLISPGVCSNSANNRRKVRKQMFFIWQLKVTNFNSNSREILHSAANVLEVAKSHLMASWNLEDIPK